MKKYYLEFLFGRKFYEEYFGLGGISLQSVNTFVESAEVRAKFVDGEVTSR